MSVLSNIQNKQSATMTDAEEQQKERDKKIAAEAARVQEAAGGGANVTPLAAKATGVNPDQAKMAGTPAQTNAASANILGTPQDTVAQAATQQDALTAAPREDTLQQRLATRSYDDATRNSAQERAAAFSEKMKNLGALGDRVQNLVFDQFTGLDTQDIPVSTFEVDQDQIANYAAEGVTPEQITPVLNEFNTLIQGEDPQKAYDYLASNSDLFNDSSGLIEMISQSYGADKTGQIDAVANLVAEGVLDPEEISLAKLIELNYLETDENGIFVDFGMTEAELVDTLGEGWKELTPATIGAAIEEKTEGMLTRKQDIEKQLSDPNLPSYMRQGLLEELKRMGSLGLIQAEQEASETVAELKDSGKVVIGGKVQDIEELLKDENVKQLAVNFLADPESEEAKEWAENNPEFAEWLNKAQEELGLKADKLTEGLDDFQGIQDDNAEFVDKNISAEREDVNVTFNKDVMEAFGFDTEGWQSGKFSGGDNLVYQMIAGLESPANVENAIKALNGLDSTQLESLKKWASNPNVTTADLEGIITDETRLKEFTGMAGVKSKWDSIKNGDNLSSEDIVNTLLDGVTDGPFQSASQLRTYLKKLYFKATLGGDVQSTNQYNSLKKYFDQDGDGELDGPETMKKAMQQLIDDEGSIEQIIGNQAGEGILHDLRNKESVGAMEGNSAWFYNLGMDTYLSNDGKIDDKELKNLFTEMTNSRATNRMRMDALIHLEKNANAFGLDATKLKEQKEKYIESFVNGIHHSLTMPSHEIFGDWEDQTPEQLWEKGGVYFHDDLKKTQKLLFDVVNDPSNDPKTIELAKARLQKTNQKVAAIENLRNPPVYDFSNLDLNLDFDFGNIRW